MVADASLTPEQIEVHAFTTGFRGYDQSEVRSYLRRLAGEIRDLREHITQLDSAWHSAEERAARPPVLDEDTLMAAVGEETASILRSARSAASDLRTRAAEESDRVLGEARATADKIQEEAKEVLARETLAAEEAANRILAGAQRQAAEALEKAQREVAEMVEKAQREAESLRAQAEQERILTLEGANATRDRILDDLSRRRRVATVQIEQLRAGRERLIESYAVVRRTLEEAQSELSRADAEARAAAEEVGRRYRVEHPVEEVAAQVAAVEVAEVEAIEALEPVVEVVEPVAEALEPIVEAPAAVEESAPAAKRAGRRRRFGLKNGSESVEAPTEVAAVGAEADEEAGPAPETPGEEPPAPATPAEGGAAASDTAVPAPAPTPEPAPAPAEATEPQSGSAVEELFAKLRSGQAAANGSETQAEEAATSEPTPDADEALLQKREAVVVDLEVTLTRKLKRALQDEQNDLLDRLRGLRGTVTADRLLPDADEQARRYADAARSAAEAAATAGARFAAEAVGSKAKAKPDTEAVGQLATDAGHNIVEPLRRRLEQAVHQSADEDQAVLIESLGAAYREWKSQRIERVAGDLLAAAFARGTWDATPAGTSLRWVVEDVDGPCPDCDDDALAGALPKEEAFPTGQHHPPAHSGCRCLLVPTA